jgi:hypothetical protein
VTPGLLVTIAIFGVGGVGCAVSLAAELAAARGRGRHQADRSADGVVRAALGHLPPVDSLLHAITRRPTAPAAVVGPDEWVRRIALPDETSDCTTCGGSGYLGGCQECHRVPLMEAQRVGGEDW